MLTKLQPIGPIASTRASALESMLGIPRAMMLAVVFVALGIVSLRPFCELAFAEHRHGDLAGFVAAAGYATAGEQAPEGAPSVTCCTSIKDGTFVKPAEPFASPIQGGSLGTVFLASAGLLLFARSPAPASKLFAVLPERSFYVRSARILR